MRPLPEEEVTQSINEAPMREQYEQYKPSADEIRKRHSINIEFLDSGCVVRIGCKSIAFTSYDLAMQEINKYVYDPITAYQKWGKELKVKLDY